MSKPKPAPTLEARWIFGTADLAEILGVSVRQLTRMRQQGMPQLGRGRWPLRECVHWALAQASAPPPETPPELDPRSELLVAQARKLHLEIGQLEGTLYQADDVHLVLDRLCALVAETLEAMPRRLAAELAGLPTPDVETALDAECRALRAQLGTEIRARFAAAELWPADSDPPADP